jgi:MFS family permease
MSVAVRLASGNVLVRMDTPGQAESIPPARHSHHFVQITAAIAALAGLLFGFDTGVISGAILFIKGAFKLAPFMEELLVSAALIGAVCGCILSGRVTDLIGRKRTILITAAIFILGSILSAVATSIGTLIIGRVAIGLGPVFWLLISEIFPLNIRGQAASVATMANWLSNFVVSLTFLSLLNGLGDVWTFLLYAALSLIGLWLCFRFVPETKGVPLERIERDLRLGRPLRDLGRTA